MLNDPIKYAAKLVEFFNGDRAQATASFMAYVCQGRFPGISSSSEYTLAVINAIWENKA